jgi:hypothetical protein
LVREMAAVAQYGREDCANSCTENGFNGHTQSRELGPSPDDGP